MAALNPAPASPAAANTNPEPGHHRTRLGQLGLELLRPPVEDDTLTTMRTTPGQWCIQEPVRCQRGQPMTMTTMGLALLAARTGRLNIRITLRERRRLAFPATPGLLQQRLQLSDPTVPRRHHRDQHSDPRLKRCDPLVRLHTPRSNRPRAPSGGPPLSARPTR
jgi:hypothetical protein